MRIEIYAAQLLAVAKMKAAQKAAARPSDIGNLMEERMVLSELLSTKEFEYNDYLDSDDEPTLQVMFEEINRIKARIAQIDAERKAALDKYRN